MTLDCPSSCPWLVAARRHELRTNRSQPPPELSYPDEDISRHFILENEGPLSALLMALRKFADQNGSLRDSGALEAIRALAETFRTLQTGIYYEKPPDAPVARALYVELARSVQDFRQQQETRGSSTPLRDSHVFLLLVFLLRMGEITGNGRRLSRAFLDDVRRQIGPSPEGSSGLMAAPAASRIVVP